MCDGNKIFLELQARANLLTALLSHSLSDQNFMNSEYDKLNTSFREILSKNDSLMLSDSENSVNQKRREDIMRVMEDRLNAANEQIDDLNASIRQLEAELTTANSICNAMIASASWRITAPLRWIKSIRLI